MALRVLLADDSVPAQNMGKKILTEAGFEVLTVGNGLEAMRKIKDIAPDVAILDIFMPGYTGLEVCKFLRADERTAELPVILTVGKLEPYRAEDGENVRSNAVIVKPFGAEELTSAVQSVAGSAAGAAHSAAAAQESPVATAAAEADQAANDAAVAEEVEVPAPTLSPIWERKAEPFPAVEAAGEDTAEAQEAAGLRFNPDAAHTSFQASAFDGPILDSTVEGSAVQDSPIQGSPQSATASAFALDLPTPDEFAIHAEPEPAAEAAEADSPRESWYGGEDTAAGTDPLLVTNEPVHAQSEVVEPDSALEKEAAAQEEESFLLRPMPPLSERNLADECEFENFATDVSNHVSEDTALAPLASAERSADGEASPASDPLVEIIEIEPSSYAENAGGFEAAFDIALGASHDSAAPEQAACDDDSAQSSDAAQPAQPDEARMQAFEALFNSDVPFPLEENSALTAAIDTSDTSDTNDSLDLAPPQAQAEPEPEVSAAEPAIEAIAEGAAEEPEPLLAEEVEEAEEVEAQPPAAEAAAEVEAPASSEEPVPLAMEEAVSSTDAFFAPEAGSTADGEEAASPCESPLAEVEADDEPIFYSKASQPEPSEALESSEASESGEEDPGPLEPAAEAAAASRAAAPERSELVAEVAKVEALLTQMQAMRLAESASSPMIEAANAEPQESVAVAFDPLGGSAAVASPEIAAEAASPEWAAASAGPLEEEEAPGAEAAPQLEPPVEVFLPSPQSEPAASASEEEAQPQAEDDKPAGTMAAEEATAESGRIQGAVEKVFERFRPMLVAAIARELAKRD